MNRLLTQLQGGDLRSVGQVGQVLAQVQSQADFDLLAEGLFAPERIVVMRAADAVEKITRSRPGYLHRHKNAILSLFSTASDKELQWHLAQLAPRLNLSAPELQTVWTRLRAWITDRSGSRIVRVNALQALHDLAQRHPAFQPELQELLLVLEQESTPSLLARIRRIRKGR